MFPKCKLGKIKERKDGIYGEKKKLQEDRGREQNP